jgi:hypothetical protein
MKECSYCGYRFRTKEVTVDENDVSVKRFSQEIRQQLTDPLRDFKPPEPKPVEPVPEVVQPVLESPLINPIFSSIEAEVPEDEITNLPTIQVEQEIENIESLTQEQKEQEEEARRLSIRIAHKRTPNFPYRPKKPPKPPRPPKPPKMIKPTLSEDAIKKMLKRSPKFYS